MPPYVNMTWTGLAIRLAMRCIAHPTLALDLVRVAWRFRARDWYRRWPFLPVPDRTYMDWRMHTAFGDHHAIPSADDVARYARWASRIP